MLAQTFSPDFVTTIGIQSENIRIEKVRNSLEYYLYEVDLNKKKFKKAVEELKPLLLWAYRFSSVDDVWLEASKFSLVKEDINKMGKMISNAKQPPKTSLGQIALVSSEGKKSWEELEEEHKDYREENLRQIISFVEDFSGKVEGLKGVVFLTQRNLTSREEKLEKFFLDASLKGVF